LSAKFTAVVVALALSSYPAWAQTPGRADCRPVQSAAPNVPEQKPALPGQTPACAEKSVAVPDVQVLAQGLNEPWAVVPLTGGVQRVA
jgi:glucose/arabinose dehydrogenase